MNVQDLRRNSRMLWTVYSTHRKTLVPAATILNGQTLRIVGTKYEVLEGEVVIATGKLVITLPMVKEMVHFE